MQPGDIYVKNRNLVITNKLLPKMTKKHGGKRLYNVSAERESRYDSMGFTMTNIKEDLKEWTNFRYILFIWNNLN